MGKRDGRDRKWVVAGVASVVLIAVAALGWGMGQQVQRLKQLQAAEAELTPLMDYEQQRHQELLQELEHVSSPAYPEEWARVHAGMTLPGEVRLVVAQPEGAAESASSPPTTAPASSETTPQPLPLWQSLWWRLFGRR